VAARESSQSSWSYARANDAPAIAVLACSPEKLCATILDDAGFGERSMEGISLLGRPAVAAVTDGYQFDGDY
jgi:hypothetical protein